MKFIGQLLGRHLQRYPQMALADVYKLLHQAAMGPGHVIDNEAKARAALREECARVAAAGGSHADPALDPISPDGRLARAHLRAWIAAGRDLDALAEALLCTARDVPPDAEKLAKFCSCLGDLADAGGIPFARAEVEAFMGDLAARGYPALRHSPAYRDAYQPAYRVVAVDLLS